MLVLKIKITSFEQYFCSSFYLSHMNNIIILCFHKLKLLPGCCLFLGISGAKSSNEKYW